MQKMTRLARVAVFSLGFVLALTVGGMSASAQGQILNTNSPQYKDIVNQVAQGEQLNCSYGFNNCYNGFYNYGNFGYGNYGYAPYGYGYAPVNYAPVNYAPNGYYGGVPNNYYGGYNPNAGYGFAYGIPDQYFTAVGCQVGNYSCLYQKTGIR